MIATWELAIVLVVILGMMLGGCSATNLASILEAAGKDPATLCGAAVYAGATVSFARTNITNGDVDCNSGHLTVRSVPPPAQPIMMNVPNGSSSVIMVPTK